MDRVMILDHLEFAMKHAAVACREGAELFSQSLRTKGVPTELVVYAGAHHGGWPTEVERDYLERERAWFGKYLK
jgi:dipeptidyl aminopeptidase/acylaminoacyl peptidase